MIALKFKTKDFSKDMNNLVKYSLGFVEGVNAGKQAFLKNLGLLTIQYLKEFIDSNARANPAMLHHVYEWYKVGSPDARLFDIHYTVSNLGLSFSSTFSQSKSIKDGSNVPFYDKAKIMENGISVKISPRNASVLKFEVNDEVVYTNNSVTVDSPGGTEVNKGFEKTFDLFFTKYFTQAFIRSSGVFEYINNPIAYKKNLRKGLSSGKSVGYQTGYRWIANAGIGSIR